MVAGPCRGAAAAGGLVRSSPRQPKLNTCATACTHVRAARLFLETHLPSPKREKVVGGEAPGRLPGVHVSWAVPHLVLLCAVPSTHSCRCAPSRSSRKAHRKQPAKLLAAGLGALSTGVLYANTAIATPLAWLGPV